MKKLLLMLACAVSFSALHAQVRFGVKAGYNYSNVAGEDADGNKGKSGFHAGVLANLPLISTISVQPEVVFSSQGAMSTDAGTPDTKVNLNYVNIPILLKLTSTSGFIIETGPQFGFLMSAKAKQGSDKEDVKEGFKSSDLGWAIGLGYMVSPALGIDARYNLGLSKIGKEEGNVKNSVIQAGLFYLLGRRAAAR